MREGFGTLVNHQWPPSSESSGPIWYPETRSRRSKSSDGTQKSMHLWKTPFALVVLLLLPLCSVRKIELSSLGQSTQRSRERRAALPIPNLYEYLRGCR